MNYIKDLFELEEVKNQKEIQNYNFIKYKKTFCDLDFLSKEYYTCLNEFSHTQKQEFHEESLKKKTKCSEIQNQYKKCSLIHKKLDDIFSIKQNLHLDELRIEIIAKKREKLTNKENK